MKNTLPLSSATALSCGLILALLALCGCGPEQQPPADAKPQSAEAASATNSAARPATPATEAKDEKPPPAVTSFEPSEGRFCLRFTDRPDLTALPDYVKVTPDPGPLAQGWWNDWLKSLWFSGAFKPRTTYQIVVRAGCPMADGRVTKSDFRRTWTQQDYSQSVEFAAAGRYLPAGGRRAVAVRTMNVTNLQYQIHAVPLHNVVQLLAREEDCYRRYYGYGGGGDSMDTAELADEPVSCPIRVEPRLNETCTTLLDVRNGNGEIANGIYLLSVREESSVKPEYCYEYRRHAKRLVCVTDIGLSVRETKGTVSVWATSLTRGTPIKGLRVLVYGANNIKLGEAFTDAEGWCRCAMPDAGQPFAVIATQTDGGDASFLALRNDLDETSGLGTRRAFLEADESEAFVWTDRGIYRHDEPILVNAILRNGKGNAPKPFPVTIELVAPNKKVFQTRTLLTDAVGVVSCSAFAVSADQPGGRWRIDVRTPGEDGVLLGGRTVKIEEFVPPQIRVKVEPPAEGRATTGMAFVVSGEHLFGGPAKELPAEGAVMFEDAPFAPRGWEAFRFGDEQRRLRPNFTTLAARRTDEAGRAVFVADYPQNSLPRAAVKMTVQGSVFEGGGRPVTARASKLLHAYPYYIGVALPDALQESATPRACRVAIVNPDGTPHAGARRLVARFERVETLYNLTKTDSGCWEWHTDKVRSPLGNDVQVDVDATGAATLAVPANTVGDCAVTLTEEETGVSFDAGYWVGGADDAVVRTALENPSRVTLTADKPVYHPGERPRITVKAPFAGAAWVNVLRDEMIYSQVVTLTNATCELTLEPVAAAWAPGVDVALSVVQAVRPGERAVANRAFGLVPIRVATRDSALAVTVTADVVCAPAGGSQVTVELDAHGEEAVGETATVTLVDEGIHFLTDERTPDPVGWFGASRSAEHPLWDIYNRLLPLLDDRLKRADAKTGGGAESDLFRRVSPVPTRRFKPLSQWRQNVALTNGCATVPFTLPEFVGEVRVTAVACNRRATGAGAVQVKVSPKLVMQPDAPRFAAPGDTFLATVTFSNRSGKDGTFAYGLTAGGAVSLERPAQGELKLADGQSETLAFPVKAGTAPGQGTLVFVSEGFGERHTNTIELPVRPAAPWAKTAVTVRLAPGESRVFPNTAAQLPEAARRTFLASDNPVAELASALEHLVDYPYGCLEQTTARIFPLIAAGGILNTLPVRETSAANDAKTAVAAGIRRVCSMIRANDFAMWPDDNQPPWDRSVSLWAAHFLVEAAGGGFAVPKDRLDSVTGFLRNWSMSTNATESVYACQTLALAGTPDRDRMLQWFDCRASLPLLDRARLARAFQRTGDPVRARELLAQVHATGVKDAAFALMALLDLDAADTRIPALVTSLLALRASDSGHWNTTEGNAHALLALGAYYRTVPPAGGEPALVLTADGREESLPAKQAKRLVGGGDVVIANRGTGPAFLTASTLAIGDPAACGAETNGIAVSRRYLRMDGREADLANLVRGELIIAEVTLASPSATTTYSDLVIEELLPACFEPDPTAIVPSAFPWAKPGVNWELRRERRDDRVIGFSRRFVLKPGVRAIFRYAVRVVSAGDFVLPGPSVEAMYDPALRARGPSGRVRIAK